MSTEASSTWKDRAADQATIREQAATIAKLKRQLSERTREVIGDEFIEQDVRLQKRCAAQAATIERLEKERDDAIESNGSALAQMCDTLRAELAEKHATIERLEQDYGKMKQYALKLDNWNDELQQQLAACQAALQSIRDEAIAMKDARPSLHGKGSVLFFEAPERIRAKAAALAGDTTALDEI